MISQLYVNYECDVPCTSNNSSITSLHLQSLIPETFALNENGNVTVTSDLTFMSAKVVDLQNSTETVLYELSIATTSRGYYSSNLPYGCSVEPILYVKDDSSGPDSNLIRNWLGNVETGAACWDEVQVTILGFTNSYYAEIPFKVPSS